MARDEQVYADPLKFHPERFLPKSAGGNDEPYPIGPFGFGRRCVMDELTIADGGGVLKLKNLCTPGQIVSRATCGRRASGSSWRRWLSTITISRAKDADGQEITPEFAFDVGLTAYAGVHLDTRLLRCR